MTNLEAKRLQDTMEHFTRALQASGAGVDYSEVDPSGKFYTIHYTDGAARQVNIDGDSPVAAMRDILRYAV